MSDTNLKQLCELGFFLGYTADLPDYCKVDIAKKTSMFKDIAVEDSDEGRRAFIEQVSDHTRNLLGALDTMSKIAMLDGIGRGEAAIAKIVSDYEKGTQ